MVPVQWVDFEISSAALISISVKEALPAPTIVVVRRAGLPLTPAAQQLSDLLRRKIPIPLKTVSKVAIQNKQR
jgi:LysR family transcriptional regulator, regulator of abg operon